MWLRFDHPEFLLLAALAVPLVLVGWRALSLTDPLRRWVALGLRTLVLLALAVILAGPQAVREHDHLTVIGLLDISGSVQRFAEMPPVSIDESANGIERRSNIEYLRNWFRQATQTKAPDDRFGLVVFDGKAIAISTPTRGDYVDDNLDVSIVEGTNIAQAVRLGIAMFPADAAKRLVLVSDGNETAGSVLESVRQAAGDSRTLVEEVRVGAAGAATRPAATIESNAIPIDVLPIAYNISGDVQVARVEAPPTALPEQAVTVRIILESAGRQPVPGRLSLRREGIPVDLNGAEPGTSRRVEATSGQSVHFAEVELGQTPINRFEAVFEADDPTTNRLVDNDRAEAFTATPSRGSVLVLNSRAEQRDNALVESFNAAGLPAVAQTPAQLPDDLLSLQNFDLIVLDNVSAAEFSSQQQELLVKYVQDLGGGLIMVGGDNSFGAGGWNGTPVESLLPLELDPARQLRLPTAALVLVLDKSGSMNQPVAGARASQQEIANEGAAQAIESMRADSMVGVVTFDMFAHVVVPLQANENPKAVADRVRGITADGGTNLEPGLLKAFAMLKDEKVAKKRVVCMSDGRSHSTEELPGIAARMAEAGIQVSAIAVGDDADHEMMMKIAEAGGGEFYAVRDPRTLPRVLVESVQVLNKPLLKEGPFVPQVLPTGSTLTAGMDAAPPLGGIVITSAKDDPKIMMEMLHPEGEPLLAHWQTGLGRVAAFTSAAPGEPASSTGAGVFASNAAWATQWLEWPEASAFWVQLARITARPAMSQDAELITTIQNNRLQITYERSASGSDGEPAFLDYLQVDGTVYRPDGTPQPIHLRQTGPGRYEASAEADVAGNYIVAVNPRQGARQLAPAIGGASQSTSPEFRRYTSNLGLLEEIVETTGGRRLSVDDPLAVSLFDRSGMPHSVSHLPIWRMVLIWTLALLLLDVACRRIAWDYNLLKSLVQQAIARVTPSHVRATEAAATLATLRRVSDQVDQRQAADSAGLTKFEGTGRIAPPPDREVEPMVAESDPTTRRIEPPEPGKVAAALDAMLGRSKAGRTEPPTAQPTTGGDAAAATETTSNLLAAKRRTRKRLGGSAESTSEDRPA